MMSVLQAIDRAARLGMLAIALVSFNSIAHAQQHRATAAGMATAKEIVALTGATTLFNPLIAGVIEQAKGLFLQQNPALAKDINEVAANLRTQLQPRFVEIANEVAREYATRFTDKELTELLAFYKTPVGKKLIVQQPLIADASLRFAQDWANKLSEEVMNKMRAEMKKRGHDM
jgi:uncharacterized protein